MGVLLGFLLWGDLPPSSVVLGCAVVVASGLFILYRETQLWAGAGAYWAKPRAWMISQLASWASAMNCSNASGPFHSRPKPRLFMNSWN